MSIVKQNHQIDINGDKVLVNDSDQINDTISGAAGTVNTLHDQPIEEKKSSGCDVEDIKNAEDNNKSIEVNLIDINLLKRNSMAIYYGWQIVCLIIFIFTIYSTLQSVLPKGEKYPEPQRFFSSDSFVQDYPHGNLGVVQKRVALSDLSFCAFYAPWSADSQHARVVLEAISKKFYREANFMAINCWQPDGECRLQYKKVMSWPVLMAYSKNNIAVPYNGQWTESALARFVYLMLRPLQRINKPEQLLEIIHNHDAVVTLFVNMDTGHTFYNIFHQAATKWLEKDPQGDVAFVVVTGETMNQFGIEREPSLRLYLWNRTVEYEDEVWKASLIHKWIIQNKQQVTQWLAPPGSKSKEFDAFITKGPVLILFTPRNLFDFSNDAYAMIRQIGYEYYNCANDAWLNEMGRNYIYNQRKINIGNYYLQTKECELLSSWKNSMANKCPQFGRHSFAGIGNSSKIPLNTVKSKGKVNDYCEKLPEPYEQMYEKSTFTLDGLPTSIVDTKNDLRSSENVFTEWKDIHCKMINLSKKLRSQIFQDTLLEKTNNSSQFDFQKITGLACKTNKTLSFLAMDSLSYGLVAEKLGISLRNVAQNTAAVIIDGQDESSYVLKDTLSTTNLIDFVYNYTMNKVSRHLRHDQNTKHSHYYRSVSSQSDQSYHPNIDQKTSKRKFESINIPTISSENFTSFLSEPHRTVAVLFTSSQCAFCTIFSSTLLTVSRILGNADYIKFARIDSDKNDLPWQYTMETVPAFIVFNNKLDSRKWPLNMEVSVQNVLGFILSNLNRSNRLRAIASIVKYRSQQKQSIESAINVLRRETEDNIIDSLRAWRLNTRKRNYILRRIQALRHLYFTLYNQASNRDLNTVDKLINEVLMVWMHENSVQ